MPKCFQTRAKVLFIHLGFSTLLQNFLSFSHSIFLSLSLFSSFSFFLFRFRLSNFLSLYLSFTLSTPFLFLSASISLFLPPNFLLCGSKIVHKFAVYTSTTVNLLDGISIKVCRLPSLQWCPSSYKAMLRPS